MKNLHEVINSLTNHGMFVTIDNNLLLKLKNFKTLKGFRNDGTGSRLMAYINLVRLAKKLKKKYIFYWDIRSDSFSSAWPHNVIASEDIYKYLPNIKNIKFYNSINYKISQPYIYEWKFLMLKNEKKENVLKECIKILKNIFKNNTIIKNKKEKKYNYGLHIRCGGINATNGSLTKKTNKIHFYKEEFNLGKWYPNEIWSQIIYNIKKRGIIISDDYNYIKNNFKSMRNFTYETKKNKKNSDLFAFFKDIFKVSNADNVICSLKSGTGLIIMLSSVNKFYTPEKFLKIEKLYFSFSNIIEENFYKFNRLQSLIDHNMKYFGSKPIKFFKGFKEKLKKNL